MRVSFSRIDLYHTCPYKWKLKYIDELEPTVNTDIDASNPLLLGKALHAGIEGLNPTEYYFSQFNIINDAHINFSIQIEDMVKKCLKMLPKGQHEMEINYKLENGNEFL